MKILKLILFFISVFHYSQIGFRVNGELKGFSDSAVVKITKDNLALDSCKLKKGKFFLKGLLHNSPSNVYLLVKDGDEYKYSSLFIGNENILVKADKKDFPYDVKTSGSKYDQKRFESVQQQKNLQMERNKLLQQMFSLREQKKWNDSLQKAYWSREEPLGKIIQIDNKTDSIQKRFIQENINSYYGLYLLDIAKTTIDKEQIKNILKKLKPEFKKNIYLNSINAHLKYPELQIGQKFYDFNVFTLQNKNLKFSDFFNGKNYILLDFSTVYCGFCLTAIPHLEKLKEDTANLEIVTFYVDNDERGLLNLSKKHTPSWPIIWDKKGRLGETYAKYKIGATPTFYLFKPDGTLIKKIEGLTENLNEEIMQLVN